MVFTVAEIIEWTGGRVVNESDLGSRVAEVRVDRPAPLAQSRSTNIAYFFSRAYEKELMTAAPGILVTGDAFVKPMQAAKLPLFSKSVVIACKDPYMAMALVSEKMAAKFSSVAHVAQTEKATEIHPTAVVHSTAELAKGVQVGPYCIIEEGVKIGKGTILYPHCYIGGKVTIGEGCVIFPRVTLYEWTQIGNRVRIHAGVVLGADGFGYAPKIQDGKSVGHQKIYHLGNVVVGDDAEIGANTCIDRGTVGPTLVEKSAKIDDLVMIGHNCQIHEGAVICGHAGLAGSAIIDRYAIVGGLAGISNQVHVGPGAKVGACSLISKDVPAGETASGNPQRDHQEHLKIHAMLSRMLAERRSKK